MSFASDVKTELCGLATEAKGRQRLAQAYGLALFSRAFSRGEIAAQTEHPALLRLLVRLFSEFSGEEPTVTQRNHAGTAVSVVSLSERGSGRLWGAFGLGDGDEVRINHAVFAAGEPCHAAFLRGAFLGCGKITDPLKAYHLEFDVGDEALSGELSALLHSVGFSVKETRRKGRTVLYLKDSDPMEELLTVMGALQSVFRLMDAKIYKDIRNKANRVRNCETANIDKTVQASITQVEDIRFVLERRGGDSLPPDLYEIAVLRTENPELSLRELGEMTGERLSRSGVHHRLGRITELASRLREEESS